MCPFHLPQRPNKSAEGQFSPGKIPGWVTRQANSQILWEIF